MPDVGFEQHNMYEDIKTSLRPNAMDNPSPPSVSKLAAKVAHELNNPLDAVLRYISLAQRKARLGDYSDIERYLNDAQFGLQRMVEILRELMEIGRQTNDVLGGPAPLPLLEVISHARRTVAPLAEQRQVTLKILGEIRNDIRTDLRLSQVLANVLKNAIEASPENAVVDTHVESTAATLTIHVVDNGAGFNESLHEKLFMPFVTTKAKGSGHGLGLAISRELMMTLGGTLTLANREPPQCGCVATIQMPLMNA